ncbi:MAG: hypothetical protein Hals2KO_23680 [Halioglobus sp.]
MGRMEQRFNIYYAAQVVVGRDPAEVRENLGKLFKANEQTLDKLFSGKPQLLKRDCDEATAQKYQQAMQRAGAVALVRAVQEGAAAPAPAAATEPTPSNRPLTAAERIAALAAAEGDSRFRADAAPDESPAQNEASDNDAAGEASPGREQAPQDGSLGLEPAGTAVLKEEERTPPVQREVDTGDLAVDAGAQRLSDEPPPPPPAPDTSHLDMGAPGETIPNLRGEKADINPDISALDLSPEGTDFTDCAAEEPIAPDIDLSALDLAPSGGELLEQSERRRQDAAPPTTDHLSVED